MSREEAERIDSEFRVRLRNGNPTITISFEETVRLRHAWLVLSDAEPAEIRRVLEEEWGVPLD